MCLTAVNTNQSVSVTPVVVGAEGRAAAPPAGRTEVEDPGQKETTWSRTHDSPQEEKLLLLLPHADNVFTV